MIEVFGIVSGICFSISGLPQACRAIRNGHTQGISSMTIWLVIVGTVSMLAYILAKYGLDILLSTEHVMTLAVWSVLLKYTYFPRVLKIQKLPASASSAQSSGSSALVKPAIIPSLMRLKPTSAPLLMHPWTKMAQGNR